MSALLWANWLLTDMRGPPVQRRIIGKGVLARTSRYYFLVPDRPGPVRITKAVAHHINDTTKLAEAS